MQVFLWAALAVALFSPAAALAAVMTLDDALARARGEAPDIVAARLRPEEARGRLAAAAALFHDNPVVDAAAGRRSSDRGVSTDVDAGISQSFELGGRRGARVAGAEAEVERARAGSDDTTRLILREVASAFLRALAAQERLHVHRMNAEIANDLADVAERRHHAGDIADLERNTLRVAASRAHADLCAAEAARERTLAELRIVLGMEAGEPVELRGDLRQRRVRDLEELLTAASHRPDLLALAAEVRAAEAEVRLGEGFEWPEVGLRLGYEREEGADIPRAGISVSLPLFSRGQEQRLAGDARARRLRIELETRRRAVEVEVRAAFDAYRRTVEGVDDLQRHAVPLLDDNDMLARRSYEAGEVSLPDYLLVRRETVGARLDYVERSLEAAIAAVDVESRAGALR